jgi:hypothetical protein
MTSDAASAAYDLIAEELREDPDDDVEVTADGLRVHGRIFAFLSDDALVVSLPPARAADLVARGVARGHDTGDGWVEIDERDLWSELAAEAHTFVGEPPVGRQS